MSDYLATERLLETVPEGEEIPLEILTAATMHIVNRELLLRDAKLEVSDTLRFAANQMVLKLSKHILAEHLIEADIPVHFCVRGYPSRWQRWKAERGPRWLRRLLPPRLSQTSQNKWVHVQDQVTFPESTIQLEELGRPYRVQSARLEGPHAYE